MDDKSKRFLIISILLIIIGGVAVFNLFQKEPTATKVTEKYVSVEINEKLITAEIAKTPQQITRGLSDRKSLPKDEGMLFFLGGRRIATFWMKDMLFPIDIIWIDNEKVVYIIENAPPPNASSTPTYTPDKPSTHVLEVNAGFAQKHNIKVGAKVTITN